MDNGPSSSKSAWSTYVGAYSLEVRLNSSKRPVHPGITAVVGISFREVLFLTPDPNCEVLHGGLVCI